MERAHGAGSEQVALAGVVRDVRSRWRLKHALRGATIAVLLGFVVLALSALAMRWLNYSETSVLAFRIVALLALAGVAVRFVVLPLRKTPRDDQVALYVEEHEPSLDGALVTAVDVTRSADAAVARSSALAGRLLRQAADGMRRVSGGKRVDASELQRSGATLFAVVSAVVVVSLVGPQFLRHGVKLLLTPWDSAPPTGVFRIAVTPGNATVAKGGDQLISARLRGFDAERVELLVRPADSSSWTRLAMTADSLGEYTFRLFDVGTRTEYSVEATGVRSAVFHLDVSNLPYVKRLDLEYRYPAYTQIPPQQVDSSGDIAALKGTMVRIRVTPTATTGGGRVIVDGGDTLQLAPTSDGALIAMLRVQKTGFYKIELQGPDGRYVTGSLDYTIDALPDRPPTVSFSRPGRDQKVLAVDEVYSQAKAKDDYGVAKLELVYSVNGGDEKAVPLHEATMRVIREIDAGHTFMLENERLQPGDVVSYYARAVDNNTVSGAQQATSDIYFLNVRRYDQDYRQQQGGGGGGGGGEQEENPGSLSDRQRQIIAGTFNTARDSATIDRKKLQEDLATLRLAQQKLREDASTLARRLVERGIAAGDAGYKKIAEILPVATAQMDSAERKLAAVTPRGALQPEQKALQQLQRAEAVFKEIQVRQGQQQGGGGGGGGGGGSQAQDLADIFEMQRDKMRNQYEQVQRGDPQQQQQESQKAKIDETLEKLKQLAARQQQEDERARRKADSLGRSMGQSGAQGGAGQRQLAQEAEEAARQLERLAREQQSPQMAEAARRLQEASDAMRKSAANGPQGGANSRAALDRLQEARRLLDQEKNGAMQRDVEDAQKSQRNLASKEQQVAQDVAKFGEATGANKQQLQQQLTQQKSAMADSVKDLTSRLDKLAAQGRREQPAASRALSEAADTLRGRRTEDKVRASQNALRAGSQDYLNVLEQMIGTDIADLGQRLQKAAAAASQTADGQRQAQALDKMRELVRGLESMDERARQQQDRAQQGQNGQQGQQQNQQGRQGQQGQQGPQGQQGQGDGRGQQAQDGRQGGGGANQGGGGFQNRGGQQNPGQDRQLNAEMGQRLADAQALRNDLNGKGVDVSQLDRAIEGMQAATRASANGDPNAAAALRAQMIDGLKAFEFSLWRSLGATDSTRVVLGRPGEVPPAFRAYVEEYYRAIAKPKKP